MVEVSEGGEESFGGHNKDDIVAVLFGGAGGISADLRMEVRLNFGVSCEAQGNIAAGR